MVSGVFLLKQNTPHGSKLSTPEPLLQAEANSYCHRNGDTHLARLIATLQPSMEIHLIY